MALVSINVLYIESFGTIHTASRIKQKKENMVREIDTSSQGEQFSDSEHVFDIGSDTKSDSNLQRDSFDPLAGRDGCKCPSDYRGDDSEIFCPRCQQEVKMEWSSDEQETEYPTSNTKMLRRIEITRVNDGTVSDDSGSTFDSWPSADEEEIVKSDGKKEFFRLRQVIKDDLNNMTGTGSVADTDYDGDIDEPK